MLLAFLWRLRGITTDCSAAHRATDTVCFEISPTLKLLFSAEEIQALTTTYKRLAAGEAVTAAPVADPDDEADA